MLRHLQSEKPGVRRREYRVGHVILITHDVRSSDFGPGTLGTGGCVQGILVPIGRPGHDKFVSQLYRIKRRHIENVNQMHHRGTTLVMSRANVELGSSVRSNQAVAEVKGHVTQIADAGISIPIPADDITGFHLAKRRHFLGITGIDEASGHNPGRGRFAVGRCSSAGNIHSGATHVRLTADAAGDKMRAIIASGIYGSGSEYARAIEPKVRVIRVGPEIAVAGDVGRVIVGIRNRPGAVVLIGIASTHGDLHGDRGSEKCAAGVIHLETVRIRAGSFRRYKLATERCRASGRDVFAAGNRTAGKVGRAANSVRDKRNGSEAVLADEIQGISAARPGGSAAIGHGPGLGEDGPGNNRCAIGDGDGKQLVAINGEAAAHHGYSKAQNDNNKTYLKSYLVIFHVYREDNNDEEKARLPSVSSVISERS